MKYWAMVMNKFTANIFKLCAYNAYNYNFTGMEAVAVVIAISISNLKTNKHTVTKMTHDSVSNCSTVPH